MSIINTIASRAFPEGNFQSIRANAPNQMSYNIDATRDLVQNQPFNPLAPAMAATFSLPYDTIQGIGRAFKGFEPQTGIMDYDDIPDAPTFRDIGKSIAAENPIDSLIGRTYGATLGLGDKLTDYGKSLADMFESSAMANEPMSIEDFQVQNIEDRPIASVPSNFLNYRTPLNARNLFTPVREGITTLTDQVGNLKDKGLNFLGSGKQLALRGIGSIIGGPVGSFIGGVLGGLKESPTDKFNLEIGKEFGDKYGYKSDLQHGNLGARQDPFGRNLVSAFSNYELNRMKEVAKLSALEKRNKFQQDLLDYGKQYLQELEEKRQAKIQEMQTQNRADKRGGYQSDFAQDKDFMEGSGTAKDMGSF